MATSDRFGTETLRAGASIERASPFPRILEDRSFFGLSPAQNRPMTSHDRRLPCDDSVPIRAEDDDGWSGCRPDPGRRQVLRIEGPRTRALLATTDPLSPRAKTSESS